MRTKNFIWLSADMFEPEDDRLCLVECEDGYITTGSFDGTTWWSYDHKKHENHPTPPSNPVVNFCDLPDRQIGVSGSCSLWKLKESLCK